MKRTETRYYLGIDAGGTKCHARLTDSRHNIIGEGQAGASNLSQMKEKAILSITESSKKAFQVANLSLDNMINTEVGLGISGAELPTGHTIIKHWKHPFASLTFDNDAFIACLGAHLGKKGAILSIGTGIVGWENTDNYSFMRGGWGFPLSDIGSGAWLGLRALQETLKADDGIIPHSPLTRHLLNEHKTSRNISAWAFSARSGQFGQYAKVVADYFTKQDGIAKKLISEQVCEVENFLYSMIKRNPPRLSLLGGMADFLHPLLKPEIQKALSPPLGDALTGALILIRQNKDTAPPHFSHPL